eukprot:m.218488 g.218488  ORF g.218488 m.218488 type:complete len:500 (-) comp17220_c0_seq17:1072-2571(-)
MFVLRCRWQSSSRASLAGLQRCFSLQSSLHPTAVATETSSSFPVTNPATAETITHLETIPVEALDVLVQQAAIAQPLWHKQGVNARSDVMMRWYHAILENQDYLAALMTSEQGKPLTESRGEVVYAASFIRWFAEEAPRHYGETFPPNGAERILTIRQPVGVCCSITPWNFPLAMIARKAGAALAAGCSVLTKPAHQTPLSAQALLELAYQAGVPRDIMPLVVTPPDSVKETGKMLATHPTIRKLSFTGSTAVGKVLMQQAASNIKKLSLELGGNAPFIVLADADLDAAVQGAIASKFRNSGQTCVCTNRFLVHSSLHKAFTNKLSDEMLKLRLGNGMEKDITQGPLIDDNAVVKVEGFVQDAVDKGATLVQGGQRSALGGSFFQPTLLDYVTPNMKLFQEEVFGPVAGVTPFDSIEEAISLSNATSSGLASYVYGQNLSDLMNISEALEYGMVGVNTGIISAPQAPFGGVKESGLGREGSSHGLDDYTEIKYINMKLN